MDGGILYEIRNELPRRMNAAISEHITLGLLGKNAINQAKLDEEEGKWGGAVHAMRGFDIDSYLLTTSLPEA